MDDQSGTCAVFLKRKGKSTVAAFYFLMDRKFHADFAQQKKKEKKIQMIPFLLPKKNIITGKKKYIDEI